MRALLITIVAAFFVQASFAQSFFPNSNTQKPTSSVPSTGSPKIMSPDEFKSAVQTFNKQEQTKINNEVTEDLKNRLPNLPSSNTPTAGNQGIQNQNTSVQSSPQPAQSSGYSISNAPNAQAPQPQLPSTPSTNNQGSFYSGFGAGNANPPPQPATQPPKDTNTGGGWNVRY